MPIPELSSLSSFSSRSSAEKPKDRGFTAGLKPEIVMKMYSYPRHQSHILMLVLKGPLLKLSVTGLSDTGNAEGMGGAVGRAAESESEYSGRYSSVD